MAWSASAMRGVSTVAVAGAGAGPADLNDAGGDLAAALSSLGVAMYDARQVERGVELQATAAMAAGVATTAPLPAVRAAVEAARAEQATASSTDFALGDLDAAAGAWYDVSGARVSAADVAAMRLRILENLMASRVAEAKGHDTEWLVGGGGAAATDTTKPDTDMPSDMLDSWVLGAVAFYGGECTFMQALEHIADKHVLDAEALFGDLDDRALEAEVASGVRRLRTGRSTAGRLTPRDVLTEDECKRRVLRVPTAADAAAIKALKPRRKVARAAVESDSDGGGGIIKVPKPATKKRARAATGDKPAKAKSRSLNATVRGRSKATADDGNHEAYLARVEAYYEAQKDGDGNGGGGDGDREEDVVNLGKGLNVPRAVMDRLYPYQRQGVKWLWGLHNQDTGGILADEMGLGKTAQMVALLSGLKVMGKLRPSLIVCPATVMSHWVQEFAEWYPPMRVLMMHDSGAASSRGMSKRGIVDSVFREGDIVVTNYAGLRNQASFLLKRDWGYVVLDEGHYIRNPKVNQALIAKQLRTTHRIILTGAPIQNRLRELWSLFDFVFPNRLGTLQHFEAQFTGPIAAGGWKTASAMQKHVAYETTVVLRSLIQPYLLRRLKKDVNAQLPSKTEQILMCRLTTYQRNLYRKFLGSREVEDVLAKKAQPFRAIGLLRKICNHPDLFTAKEEGTRPEDFGDVKRSGKMRTLANVLNSWNKPTNKVLLFTQGTQALDIIQRYVESMSYTYMRMDGTTPIRQRQRLVDQFNKDPDVYLFLLTTKVGGLGVNLTGANCVLIFDPDWNPSTDIQARERAWRLGQERNVTILRLVAAGTIEEKVYHRQIYKQMLTKRVLSDPRQTQAFNSRDLFDLFSLDEGEGTRTADMFSPADITKADVTKMVKQDRRRRATVGGKARKKAGKRPRPSASDDAELGATVEDALSDGGDDGEHAGQHAKVLQALFDGSDLKGVFSHDTVEAAAFAGGTSTNMRAQARRIAQAAAKNLTVPKPRKTKAAPQAAPPPPTAAPPAPPPPPLSAFRRRYGTVRALAAVPPSGLRLAGPDTGVPCGSCRRALSRNEDLARGALCSVLPTCRLNFQLFGRMLRVGSFMIRSQVVFGCGVAAPAASPPSAPPSARSRIRISVARSRQAAHRRRQQSTGKLLTAPTRSLPAHLTADLAGGEAAFFGGAGAAVAPKGQLPSSMLLQRMRSRMTVATAAHRAGAGGHAAVPEAVVRPEEEAAAKALMGRLVKYLKRQGGTSTTASILTKFKNSVGDGRPALEFREMLNTVATCDGSVWYLKPDYGGGSSKRRRAARK